MAMNGGNTSAIEPVERIFTRMFLATASFLSLSAFSVNIDMRVLISAADRFQFSVEKA